MGKKSAPSEKSILFDKPLLKENAFKNLIVWVFLPFLRTAAAAVAAVAAAAGAAAAAAAAAGAAAAAAAAAAGAATAAAAAFLQMGYNEKFIDTFL